MWCLGGAAGLGMGQGSGHLMSVLVWLFPPDNIRCLSSYHLHPLVLSTGTGQRARTVMSHDDFPRAGLCLEFSFSFPYV